MKTSDRKAAKREYKEGHRPAGVYRLVNQTNGRMLVGSSANLPAIWNRLRMTLDAGSHLMHPELQRDWKAHGVGAFEFEVLAELPPPEAPGQDQREDLKALEELWLEELQPYDEKGYNRRPNQS